MHKQEKQNLYKAMLYSKTRSVAEEQRENERKDNALYIIKCYEKAKSIYFKQRYLRLLALYADLDLVKKSLLKIYSEAEHASTKALIKEIHDGTIDLSDLREEVSEYEDEIAEINKPEEYEMPSLQTMKYMSSYSE